MKHEPAFPHTKLLELAIRNKDWKMANKWKGLTKREYFAGLAMSEAMHQCNESDAEFVSKKSIKFADALIKELEKGSGE